jgi:glycosyltransferase involved in cell wall biosynthesis
VSAHLPLGSVVIPAHNEAGVIRRCLDAVVDGFAPGELDVVVVGNGCRDDTVALARSSPYPVRVIDLAAASKPAALRAGDAAALCLPRLYLDADVVLSGAAARAVFARLRDGAVAARPPITYDVARSSALVRRYYRARTRMPAVLSSLWGAGVYGLSAGGRGRFDEFPDVVADDLWLDRQFAPDELEIVDCPAVMVMVPRRPRELIGVLRRAYRGKSEQRREPVADGRPRGTIRATLGDLVRTVGAGPAASLDAATYATFAASARVALAFATVPGRRGPSGAWERDESSRRS